MMIAEPQPRAYSVPAAGTSRHRPNVGQGKKDIMAFLLYERLMNDGQPLLRAIGETWQPAGYGLIFQAWQSKGSPLVNGVPPCLGIPRKGDTHRVFTRPYATGVVFPAFPEKRIAHLPTLHLARLLTSACDFQRTVPTGPS